MKWDPIERVRGTEDFLGGDAIASYAAGMGMKLKGHALVWHGAVPGWANGLSNADFRAAVERHIRTVADYYRGQVYAWDVVNEAIADDGPGLRDWRSGKSSATTTSPMPFASRTRSIRRRCSSTTTTAART